MTSLLGKEILARQSKALEIHAPLVIAYFLELAKSCGESDDNIEQFVCHLHAEDDAKVFESMCVLADHFSKERIALEIGFSYKYVNATHCELTWSGK